MSKGKVLRPSAVVHLDGNIKPSDVAEKLGGPMMSKIKFNFTGDKKIEHPNETKLIDEILELAVELHNYLPVLLSWGVETILPRVSSAEVAQLEGVLKMKGDRREGQIIKNYDRMTEKCQEASEKYKLKPPPLFETPGIDRTSLIYFNNDPEVLFLNYLDLTLTKCSLHLFNVVCMSCAAF